jgi:hypothetical protein
VDSDGINRVVEFEKNSDTIDDLKSDRSHNAVDN